MRSLTPLFAVLAIMAQVKAATIDEWRNRSLYALLTDRFAPSSPNAPCDVKQAGYCGGTYRSIMDKLDYIQGMGFDAVWISPTGLQLEGRTKYGEAYHGFWSIDPTRNNPHYGSEDDLKALSNALHARGMYLMVDMQVNQLCSTSTDISDAALASYSNGQLLFKKEENYHPACNIHWGDHQSEQTCWLATEGVMLMDLKTETSAVADVYKEWIPKYIAEYGIDGMRIDGTKQMGKEFQHEFCKAAGVFCIGEMAGDNAAYAGTYVGPDGIDSVFGFPMMYGMQKAFARREDMKSLSWYIEEAKTAYPDPSVISPIIDNQDNPRINSLTQDKDAVYNALVFAFLYSNMPNIYYGTEVDVSFGSGDPDNRAALWQFNPDYSTTMSPTYARLARLNRIRKEMGKVDSAFYTSVAETIALESQDIALRRGPGLLVLTNRGSGGTGSWKIASDAFQPNTAVTDLLSCKTASTAADRSLTVTWTTGEPFYFVTSDLAARTGICGGDASSSKSSATSTSTFVTLSTTDVSVSKTGEAEETTTGAGGEGSTTTTQSPGSATIPVTTLPSSPPPSTATLTRHKDGAGTTSQDGESSELPTSPSEGFEGALPSPTSLSPPAQGGNGNDQIDQSNHISGSGGGGGGMLNEEASKEQDLITDNSTSTAPPPIRGDIGSSSSSSAPASNRPSGAVAPSGTSAGQGPTGRACKKRSRARSLIVALALVGGAMVLA